MSHRRSIRLFESELLERLTFVHPAVPALIWVPAVSLLLWSSEAPVPALFLAGLAVWTLAEYLLHRFVFHLRARAPAARRLVYLMHGVHHQDPSDDRRLLMPPAAAIVLASLFYLLFLVTLGAALGEQAVRPFFAGFLSGYLVYDYIHFATHHVRPRTALGRALRRFHMVHHFAASNRNFGVSSPLWDFVFGTFSNQERRNGHPVR